ncbi:hypothetical protein I312_100854 [Cryptococcus bacillisporus CA1280]|uniref:uncharacterized protein n=1 Tax=Cryptococcus bacillisporus CA1280 TaxID=1296109 RepID=UPI00336769D3
MKLPFQKSKPLVLTPFTPHLHRFSARKPHRINGICLQYYQGHGMKSWVQHRDMDSATHVPPPNTTPTTI